VTASRRGAACKQGDSAKNWLLQVNFNRNLTFIGTARKIVPNAKG
jgi:hypothetical protein